MKLQGYFCNFGYCQEINFEMRLITVKFLYMVKICCIIYMVIFYNYTIKSVIVAFVMIT